MLKLIFRRPSLSSLWTSGIQTQCSPGTSSRNGSLIPCHKEDRQIPQSPTNDSIVNSGEHIYPTPISRTLKIAPEIWRNFSHLHDRLIISSTHSKQSHRRFTNPRSRRFSSNSREHDKSDGDGAHSWSPKMVLAVSTGFWMAFKQQLGFEQWDITGEYAKLMLDARIEKQKGNADRCREILDEVVSKANTEKSPGAETAKEKAKEMMADLFCEEGNYEIAEKLYIEAFAYLIQVLKKPETDMSVIFISLKLVELYARSGDHEKAESGYSHLLEIMEDVVRASEHKRNQSGFAEGLQIHDSIMDEVYSAEALDGIVQESFAKYLLEHTPPLSKSVVEAELKRLRMEQFKPKIEEGDPELPPDPVPTDDPIQQKVLTRLNLAKSCLFRAASYSDDIWGSTNDHTINILHSAGLIALKNKHYIIAASCLQETARRTVYNTNLTDKLPDFYCVAAEALFHIGNFDRAIGMAKQALVFAEAQKNQEKIGKVRRFKNELDRDIQRKIKGTKSSWW